jgi:hypothetical protein
MLLKEGCLEEPERCGTYLWRDHPGDFNMHKGLLMPPMPVADADQQVMVGNGKDHLCAQDTKSPCHRSSTYRVPTQIPFEIGYLLARIPHSGSQGQDTFHKEEHPSTVRAIWTGRGLGPFCRVEQDDSHVC